MITSCEISKNCFAIGPFFGGGVTIWKQQVRALNLVYHLAAERRIRNELVPHPRGLVKQKRIAVIGGGVSGMTAAVAAASLGNEVWHFEQRTELCHLQAGCETRWVHPHIYEWPDPGSENPYAGLPLLTWQAGTAAEVARTLTVSYERYEKTLNGKLNKLLGATTFFADGRVSWDNCSNPQFRGGSDKFDITIIASGFGVEHGVHSGKVDSYWRNDSLNQPRPGIRSEKSELIFISGTGDGGLVDVLRSKIRGYNQSKITQELFTAADRSLVEKLRTVKATSPALLFDAFSDLWSDFPNEHAGFWTRLNDRLRHDVVLILNGREPTLRDTLRLNKASLQNSFLTYILYIMGAFTYVPGELIEHGRDWVMLGMTQRSSTVRRTPHTSECKLATTKAGTKYSVDRVIVRHGTDKEDCLMAIGFKSQMVRSLEERQSKVGDDSFFKVAWDPGWWTRVTTEGLEHERKEFLPEASQALAAVFTSSSASRFTGFAALTARLIFSRWLRTLAVRVAIRLESSLATWVSLAL